MYLCAINKKADIIFAFTESIVTTVNSAQSSQYRRSRYCGKTEKTEIRILAKSQTLLS